MHAGMHGGTDGPKIGATMKPAFHSVHALPETAPPDRWRGFALRGAKTALASVLVASCLSMLTSNPFGTTMVYSFCISISCWLLIDTGRGLVAAWRPVPVATGSRAAGRWPGWAWMLAITVVGAVLGYAAGNEIGNLITGLHLPGPFTANRREILSLLVVALVPALTITYFFHSRETIATQRNEVERAERQATEQQLMLLESQLEPHMLFNTLANLRALIGVDAERAQAMLDRLIAFLRASLAGSRERFHPLADEYARLADYLALMQIRMGPRLQMHFELPAELAGASIPPLLLQPLVENSIKHGLEPKVAGGRIDVVARREGDNLVVCVRDDGLGSPAGSAGRDGTSFGLAHVRERLETLYGTAASFELASAPGGAGGTLATVRLPLSTPTQAVAGARP